VCQSILPPCPEAARYEERVQGPGQGLGVHRHFAHFSRPRARGCTRKRIGRTNCQDHPTIVSGAVPGRPPDCCWRGRAPLTNGCFAGSEIVNWATPYFPLKRNGLERKAVVLVTWGRAYRIRRRVIGGPHRRPTHLIRPGLGGHRHSDRARI